MAEEVTNKFRERIKRPTSVIQYKFMKGVERADQYLSYFTILKNHKMEQKDCALIISCAVFDSYRVHKLQNGSRLKYKSFLLEVSDYCARMTLEETPEEDDVEAADEDDDPTPPTPHAPRRDHVGRHEGAPTSDNCWRWKKEISTETLQSVCGTQKT
jgi:hypothetical protein